MAKRLLNTQRIINLSADPASGTSGEIYYNTTSNTFKYYDGAAWVSLAGGSGGLPSQSGNSGKYLTTNGTDPSWASVEALPSQTGNSGKYLTTNGTTASWSAVDADLLDGQHGSYYLDWTNATNKPDPTITLGGDLSGSITLTDLAGGTLTATINADSVALGTDTTGNYVASVSGTDGVSISGTGEGASVTIANSDKGSSQNIFKNIAVSGQSDIVADSNNDTVTFAGGTGITLTTNDTTDTLTVTNSGVTSLSGTANQITASASTGSVTLSIPSSVVFPGTVTLNADPGQALEAATKQYVDAVAQGLHIHASAQTATTANITDLSSPPASIDGVTLTNNMRVLVKNQNTTSQNGVYVYSSSTGALTRASDFDTAIEINGGDFIFITGGTINNDTGWVQTETVTTVGTDPVIFQQFSGAGTYTAGTGLALNGNQFSNTGVLSVNGSTGAVTGIAPLNSPTFTGTVTVPAPVNATDAATKGYVDNLTAEEVYYQASAPSSIPVGTIWIESDVDVSTTTYHASYSATAPTGSVTGDLWIESNIDVDVYQPTVITRYTETLSSTKTVFTGFTYQVGYEQVFLNGILMARNNDYTATNGTSITLSQAATSGDILEVISVSTINLIDTYTQAQVNALLSSYATTAIMNTNNEEQNISTIMGVWV